MATGGARIDRKHVVNSVFPEKTIVMGAPDGSMEKNTILLHLELF